MEAAYRDFYCRVVDVSDSCMYNICLLKMYLEMEDVPKDEMVFIELHNNINMSLDEGHPIQPLWQEYLSYIK